ncbi:hypothetical protein FRC01_014157, partial [Tulasnella sp. 417]
MGLTVECCQHPNDGGALCPGDSAGPMVGSRYFPTTTRPLSVHPPTGELSHLDGNLSFKVVGRPAERTRVHNELGAANALNNLGNAYSLQSRYDKAERAFREALAIHSRIGSELGAANALDGLGQIYRSQLKFQEAKSVFMEAHKIHSRIGNEMGRANGLINLGEIYNEQSSPSGAEAAFMEAHEIQSRIGVPLGVANALLSMGVIYLRQSRTLEAKKAFKDAYDLYSRLDEHLAKTLVVLGETQHAQHRYLEAEEAIMEALAIWTSLADDQGQAAASLILSQMFRSQSKLAEEANALLQAEGPLARSGQHSSHAWALDRRGDIYFAQAMYAEAGECYRLAQAIYSSMNNASEEAQELLSLGVL